MFTSTSFRLILHDLKQLGLVSPDEYPMHELGSLEFYVGLAAGASGHGLDRMALLREQRDLARQLLGPLASTYDEPKDSATATGRRR